LRGGTQKIFLFREAHFSLLSFAKDATGKRGKVRSGCFAPIKRKGSGGKGALPFFSFLMGGGDFLRWEKLDRGGKFFLHWQLGNTPASMVAWSEKGRGWRKNLRDDSQLGNCGKSLPLYAEGEGRAGEKKEASAPLSTVWAAFQLTRREDGGGEGSAEGKGDLELHFPDGKAATIWERDPIEKDGPEKSRPSSMADAGKASRKRIVLGGFHSSRVTMRFLLFRSLGEGGAKGLLLFLGFPVSAN